MVLPVGMLLTGCGDDDGALPKQDATVAVDTAAAVADGNPGSDLRPTAPDTPAVADGAAADATAAGPGDAAVDLAPVGLDGAGAIDSGRSGLDGGAADGVAMDALPSVPATIIVMPDTQYYAAAYPDVYTGQTSWIVSQIRPLRIDAVLHVGDLVDGPLDNAQWTVANTAMRALDNLVPYVIVPGNHDTDASRKTAMNSFFPPSSMPWITGVMTPGEMENNYALLDIGPQQWLVLGLEFGPRDAVVTWADGILKTYADRPAILVTHAYLYRDGTRYDVAKSGFDDKSPSFQHFIPQVYGFTASQGINDGEMLWQKLVLPNRNVRMVFSGHDTGWARLTSSRPDGSRVHQMLSDYQWLEAIYFGYGYLRILQLDYGRKTIAVQTYSPYLKQYLTDGDNQFTLDWNL